jgi:hypothetical protein
VAVPISQHWINQDWALSSVNPIAKEIGGSGSAEIAQDRQLAAEAAQQRADAAKVAADELRNEAERRNRSLQLADYVDDVKRPDLALLLSLESQKIADTVEARASLVSALQSNAHLVQFLQLVIARCIMRSSLFMSAGARADAKSLIRRE